MTPRKSGAKLEPTAAPIPAAGHEVHPPTIAGNKPGNPKIVGLSDAIKSIVDYLTEKNLKDVILVGHSYGGMVITGVAVQVPNRIRRLVYWNAFVSNNGESLNDMVPPPYVTLFEQMPRNAAIVQWSCRFQSGARLSSMMSISPVRRKPTTFSIRIQRRHSLTRFR
jgi:pimeloyl-ACP methyl ester carboxylesterase